VSLQAPVIENIMQRLKEKKLVQADNVRKTCPGRERETKCLISMKQKILQPHGDAHDRRAQRRGGV